MATSTYDDLISLAEQIRTNEDKNSNTAELVGATIRKTVEYYEGQISTLDIDSALTEALEQINTSKNTAQSDINDTESAAEAKLQELIDSLPEKIENTPTKDSTSLITSGGIYAWAEAEEIEQVNYRRLYSTSYTFSTASYKTLGNYLLEAGKDYRVVITVTPAFTGARTARFLSSANKAVLEIGSLKANVDENVFDVSTGDVTTAQKVQIMDTATTERKVSVAIYEPVASRLKDRVAALEAEDVESKLAEIKRPQTDWVLWARASASDTAGNFVSTSVIHEVPPYGLYCKVKVTVEGGTVTGQAVKGMVGNKVTQELGIVTVSESGGSSETEETLVTAAFNKLQLTQSMRTVTFEVYVRSAALHDYSKIVAYNALSGYWKSGVRFTAHAGMSICRYGGGNNLLSSVYGAWLNRFDAVEGDILFSADNVPFMCHNEDFTDLSTGQKVTVADTRAEDLRKCNYYGEYLCSFDEWVEACKRLGLRMVLDHLGDGTTAAQWQAVADVLDKYRAWPLAGAPYTYARLREAYPGMVWRTVSDGKIGAAVISAANKAAEEEGRAQLAFNFRNNPAEYVRDTVLPQLDPRVELDVYTPDTEAVVREYMPYVDIMTVDNGLSGFVIESGLMVVRPRTEFVKEWEAPEEESTDAE